MNRHHQLEEQLAICDQLDAAARARLDEHIETCPTCRQKLVAYRLMDRRLAGLPDAPPAPALRAHFYAALANSSAFSLQPSAFNLPSSAFRRLAAFGLQMGLLALLVVLAWSLWWSVPSITTVTPEPVTIEVPFEGIKLLGYDAALDPLEAGTAVKLSLYWMAALPAPTILSVVVQLVDDNEYIIARVEEYVELGKWPGGVEATIHRLVVPPEFAGGRYRWQVALLDPEGDGPLEFMAGEEMNEGMVVFGELVIEVAATITPTRPQPFTLAPLATAAALDFAPMWSPQSYRMWSPDEAWVAYWTVLAQDRYDYSQDRLHFLNVQTGQSCPFPGTVSRRYEAGERVGWLDNEQVVVFQIHGRGWRGRPCGREWTELEEPLETYPQLAGLLSPDGRYLARRRLSFDDNVSSGPYGRLQSTVTIENQMGDVIHGLTILHALSYEGLINEDGRQGNAPEPGYDFWLNSLLSDQAKWLGNDYLLIHAMPDIGPLLLHVGHRNIHVTADLFQRLDLANDYQGAFSPPYADGALDPISGRYTLLLRPPSAQLDSASPEGAAEMLLYHSATGTVELVPHGAAVNGRWLAIFDVESPTSPTGSPTYIVRLRPLDPPGNDNYDSYSGPEWPFFNADWSRMAVVAAESGRISLHGVPDWALLSEWETPGYRLDGLRHRSPSGRWFLITSSERQGGGEGLFVIPFSDETADE
jgi:hypothetical protein